MEYRKNGSLKRLPMESRSLLVGEFDNLCSDVSLVNQYVAQALLAHWASTDFELNTRITIVIVYRLLYNWSTKNYD